MQVESLPRAGRLGSRLHVLSTALLLLTADTAPLMLGTLTNLQHWRPFTAITALVVVLNTTGGLYRPRLTLSLLDDSPTLLARLIGATAVALLGADIIGSGLENPAQLTLVIIPWLLGSLALRAMSYEVIRQARRRGVVVHRTLIVGGGLVGVELASVLRKNPGYGLLPVGFVDDQPMFGDTDPLLPHLGTFDDLNSIAEHHDSQVMLFAFGVTREQHMIDVLRSEHSSRYDLFIVPRLFELTGMRGFSDHIGAIPVVRATRVRYHGVRALMKRTFDVGFSAAAIVLLSPVLIACALAVRTTGRQVIFRQSRVGKDGRLFELFKFRSMQPATELVSGTTWSATSDRRMTHVGTFLRRSSLDELPQLWNILRGHMTLVGPRPERPYFVDQFTQDIPSYPHRHRVPVGLTGLAQVSGLRGADASIEQRARYDNYYIEHWSLWGDMKVILRTVTEVFARRGA